MHFLTIVLPACSLTGGPSQIRPRASSTTSALPEAIISSSSQVRKGRQRWQRVCLTCFYFSRILDIHTVCQKHADGDGKYIVNFMAAGGDMNQVCMAVRKTACSMPVFIATASNFDRNLISTGNPRADLQDTVTDGNGQARPVFGVLPHLSLRLFVLEKNWRAASVTSWTVTMP